MKRANASNQGCKKILITIITFLQHYCFELYSEITKYIFAMLDGYGQGGSGVGSTFGVPSSVPGPTKTELGRSKENLGKLVASIEEKFSDVEVKMSDGKSLRAHRLVLAANSSVLMKMFEDQERSVKGGAQRDICIQDFDHQTVTAMIRFMYLESSLVLTTPEQAMEIYKASNKFKVQHLKDVAVYYLGRHLDDTSALDVLVLARTCNDNHLKYLSLAYITKHPDSVSDTAKCKRAMESYPEILRDIVSFKGALPDERAFHTNTPGFGNEGTSNSLPNNLRATGTMSEVFPLFGTTINSEKQNGTTYEGIPKLCCPIKKKQKGVTGFGTTNINTKKQNGLGAGAQPSTAGFGTSGQPSDVGFGTSGQPSAVGFDFAAKPSTVGFDFTAKPSGVGFGAQPSTIYSFGTRASPSPAGFHFGA